MQLLPLTLLSVGLGYLLKEFDLVALRVLFYDFARSPPDLPEPDGCQRLKGPIGAEDAVVLSGLPPIILTGELDAIAHEFTNLHQHGSSSSTSPRGTLWSIDRLADPTPRLLPLAVPLPPDVSTLHTHGLGLHGDVLFAVNHAFGGGGERVERWLVERLEPSEDGPPVRLTHLGSVTGHGGDASGEGAWSFTSRLHAAINDIAPVGAHDFFFTQFLDAPASLEGAGSGTLEGHVAEPERFVTRMLRRLAAAYEVEAYAKAIMPRLRRSRVWHCYCASDGLRDIGDEEGGACARMACEPVGPNSTCWNGIAYRPVEQDGAGGLQGYLVCAPLLRPQPPAATYAVACCFVRWQYVNDIFRRIVVEFAVRGTRGETKLEEVRQFRAPIMVDNVHVDAVSGTELWVGGVGVSHQNFFGGLAALQANASLAHESARNAGSTVPRPHVHLRPSADEPPLPAMPSGAIHINLEDGKVTVQLLQQKQLASVSWSHRIGQRLFMGSPWDDGVLVCPLS